MNFLNQSANRAYQPIVKRCRRLINETNKEAIHLFLLSPPLCGSTVIAQLIRTSPNVTGFPGVGEGQFLPEAKGILYVDQRWNPHLQIDWKNLRKIFFSYWSPLKPIRFEKSPPHIVRALELERTFTNAFFLITLRNPYAQVEGLLRRKWPFNEFGPQSTPSPPPSAKSAAEFWVRSARFQKNNLDQLQKTCFFSYEELTEKTEETIQKIFRFLPDIGSVDIRAEFTAHNITKKPIKGLRNLNEQKINKLSLMQIREINEVLFQHRDILDFFQYQIFDGD